MSLRYAALAAAVMSALAVATPSFAHEGHDHDAAPPAIAHASPRAEAQSAAFELVAVPKGGELEIWLDRFDTNVPVEGASITIETPTGSVEAVAKGPGVYGAPAPWAAKPGRTDLIFTVMAGTDMDVLSTRLTTGQPTADAQPTAGVSLADVGKISPWIAAIALTGGAAVLILLRNRRRLWAPMLAIGLVVAFASASLFAHETHDKAAAPAPVSGDKPGVTADGQIFVPKPSQRILAARTQSSEAGSHQRSIELPGRVVPDPNASGIVTAASLRRRRPVGCRRRREASRASASK